MSYSIDALIQLSQKTCPARIINSDIYKGDVTQILFERLSNLKDATVGSIAFFFSKEYQNELLVAKPSVLVTAPAFEQALLSSGLSIVKDALILSCHNPYQLMALVSQWMDKEAHSDPSEVHPSAQIHPTAKIGRNCKIGAYVVIEDHAEIGDHVVLYASCYVGSRSKIGSRTKVFAHTTIYHDVLIGEDVRIHASCVLGADGFGYAPFVDTDGVQKHQKIYHLGKVVIGNQVELGAGTLVDRGTIGDTVIGNGSKLDNHCHVAHNASIGEHSILCGGVMMAGSSHIKDHVYVGGMTGISNQVTLHKGSKVAAFSLITKEVLPGETAAGNPQRALKEHFKVHAHLNRLVKSKKGSA